MVTESMLWILDSWILPLPHSDHIQSLDSAARLPTLSIGPGGMTTLKVMSPLIRPLTLKLTSGTASNQGTAQVQNPWT